MEEKFIKLNKSDVLTLKIKTSDGKDTGGILTFDLEDIELPLRYQELIEKDKRNKEYLRNQMVIIEKKQDFTKKGQLMSNNEKEKIKALQDFFKKEIEVYNMFLGENGVQKLLNGRKIGWTTLQEIDDIIDQQIAPYLNVSMDSITKKVKEKYGEAVERSKEVLK